MDDLDIYLKIELNISKNLCGSTFRRKFVWRNFDGGDNKSERTTLTADKSVVTFFSDIKSIPNIYMFVWKLSLEIS